MKIPKALSYSSLSMFEKNVEEFYLIHLSEKAAPRQPQGLPASVGSAFDAYTKSMLAYSLFGKDMSPQFEFGAIFESQVEPQNRDFALKAGKHVFKSYKRCGAYAALLQLLKESVEPPRFEFSLYGTIGGVPFSGKPDCRFVLDRGEGLISCVFDWKVKGFCSKYNTSPSKGYETCRLCYPGNPNRDNQEHANYKAMNFRGLTINSGYLEGCNPSYADQLSIYGWLLGEQVGDENVVMGIEEIVAKPATPPLLRYARHRARVSKNHQLKLVERIQTAWKRITSGYIFTDMTEEESKGRCEILEETAATMTPDDWFDKVTRTTTFW